MSYYPKSQVKTDLYTQGGQLQLKSTKKEYKGYYWKNSRGDFFTKKNPNVEGSEVLEIIPKISSPSFNTITLAEGNDVYNKLKKVDITQSFRLPSYQKPSPTNQDYELGNFTRFFAKKTNENIYVEITKDLYNKFKDKDNRYAYKSYSVFSLIWTLTGDPSQVAQTNQNIVTLAEQNNKITGLKAYLKFNYLEFYGLYTKGGEYKLPNGQIYIGLYHIHPNKGAMVGRTHVSTPHDKLTPISQSLTTRIFPSQNVVSINSDSNTQVPPQSIEQEDLFTPSPKTDSPVPRPRLIPGRGDGNILGY